MEHLQIMRDMEAFDEAHADDINMLLATPSPDAMTVYYNQLAHEGMGSWLKVQHVRETIGKGVFADKEFEDGELVLREPKLVGIQNAHNKEDAVVCSFCFRYIGSLELQIRRKLLTREDFRPVSAENVQHCGVNQSDHSQCLERHPSHETNGLERTREPPTSVDFSCPGTYVLRQQRESSEPEEQSTSVDTSCPGTYILHHQHETSEPEEQSAKRRKALSSKSHSWFANDTFRLPFGDVFPLPQVVECCGGCQEELFCSETCVEAAWEAYHCFLCTGSKSLCKSTSLLSEFKHFADETNDIFHLAAQVIAIVISKCRKLEHVSTEGNSEEDAKARNNRILLEAWKPFAMGHKRLWWEAIALPEDVDPHEEDAFRNQMKALAISSLHLLKKALYVEKYASLFSLKVYGNIIGMFELNNLEIVVASPVEDYFIYIDELPLVSKCEAEKITGPLLEVLGEDYAAYCQGTGFFAIQSCMNHSCEPNAKAFKRDEDKNGQAVLLATRRISKGEEVTISYIDENLPWEERQAMLADYGFTCQCFKCLRDLQANMNEAYI